MTDKTDAGVQAEAHTGADARSDTETASRIHGSEVTHETVTIQREKRFKRNCAGELHHG